MSCTNRRSGRDSGPRGSVTAKAAEKITGGVGCSSSSIPSGSRIIVQNLKEIVNNPENEIYAMLKECNMDPSETVNRLLNQDNFQEVKSKRDKKKEVKDTSDSKARGLGNTTNRGGRAANDRTSRVGSNSSSYNDYGVNRSKPILKKENVAFMGSSTSILGSAVTGNTINRVPSLSANSTDTSAHVVSATDDFSLKQPVGVQHVWQKMPGQVSMADIVRMGRPHANVSSKSDTATKTLSTSAVLPSSSFQEWQSFPDLVPNNPEVTQNPNVTAIDSHLPHDGQSFVKQLPVENSSCLFVMSSSSAVLVEPSGASSLHDDGLNLRFSSHMNDNQSTNVNLSCESLVTDSVISDTSGDGQVEHFDSGSRLILDDVSLNVHTFEHHEAENANPELSAFTNNLQQLSIQNEVLDGNTADENPAVVFPDHLQVTNTDCSHLSFGSFGSVLSAGFPGSNAQNNNLKSSLEPTSTASFHHVDSRIPNFYNDDHPKSNSDENAASLAISDTDNYDQPSSSQITGVATDITHPANEIQYNIPSLTPRDALSSTPQSTAPEQNYIDTNPQLQTIPSISSMMHAYANSLQGNLITSTAQPGRQFDPPYLPLLANESMPAKYSTGVPSINEPTISLPESSFFSVPQAPQQSSPSLESGSIPTGPSVPQHMSVHPYSQSGLSMGHFANMIGYPFLHPSYAYMPSAAFPPTYTGNTAYHQSQMPAQNASAKYTLPQYKNSASLNSLQQQSASVPSGYGGFGSSSNIPGSFVLNPPSAPSNATTSFDGTLGSQYKDDNAYAASLHQNMNSNVWLQGAGSRTVSALPASTYYNLQQGQSQHSGLRQAQQQPSHYGASGYPNFYRSQVGTQEQQQMPNDALNMNSSQGVPSQSSHHHWQRNY